jgi:hypothetical protein
MGKAMIQHRVSVFSQITATTFGFPGVLSVFVEGSRGVLGCDNSEHAGVHAPLLGACCRDPGSPTLNHARMQRQHSPAAARACARICQGAGMWCLPAESSLALPMQVFRLI